MKQLSVKELIELLSKEDQSMLVYADVEETHHPITSIWISEILSGKDKGTKYVCIVADNE